jgi:hypothetical protein
VLVVCGILAAVAACTSSPVGRSSRAAPSLPASGAATATRPVGEPVELSCADAAHASPGTGGGNLTVGGLTIEGAANELRGTSAATVGLRVPGRRTLYFVKAPAYLKAGTSPVTVELRASSSGYLAWVPAAVWTSGQYPVDLRRWATSRLTFDGCPDREAAYLGGLLATDPHICLTVDTRQAGAPPSPLTRLGGDGC